MVGTRIGFRISIMSVPLSKAESVMVLGRIVSIGDTLTKTQVENALSEIEMAVNEKLPHLRLHISQE